MLMIVLIGASSQMQKKSHVPLIPLLMDPFNIVLNVLITAVHVLFITQINKSNK